MRHPKRLILYSIISLVIICVEWSVFYCDVNILACIIQTHLDVTHIHMCDANDNVDFMVRNEINNRVKLDKFVLGRDEFKINMLY